MHHLKTGTSSASKLLLTLPPGLYDCSCLGKAVSNICFIIHLVMSCPTRAQFLSLITCLDQCRDPVEHVLAGGQVGEPAGTPEHGEGQPAREQLLLVGVLAGGSL